MDNTLWAFLVKEYTHLLLLGNIQLTKAKSGLFHQLCQPILFQFGIIIIIQIINADDFLTTSKEAQAGMITDKTGGAGDQHFQNLYSTLMVL